MSLSRQSAYFAKLQKRCEALESSLCVGLDPDPALMPAKAAAGPESIYKFVAEIIEATSDFAAAYKPNLAFYESVGTEGHHLLTEVLGHIPKEIPVILDAKRGDIGSTASHYARALFDGLEGDAVTVNPLLGRDSLQPFMDYHDKGIYILCMTSNPGAEDFQTWFDLYLQIAKRAQEWNKHGNLGLVVGATKPAHLSKVWSEAPDMPLLIPGVGTQGGNLEAILAEARNKPRHKVLINVSRSVIHASQKPDYARAARKAAQGYRDRINQALATTQHK